MIIMNCWVAKLSKPLLKTFSREKHHKSQIRFLGGHNVRDN